MLFSKTQLDAIAVASTDASRPVLNGLHVAPDGTVTACDGNSLIRVRPPQSQRDDDAEFPRLNGDGDSPAIPKEGIVLPATTVKEVARAIPKRTHIPILAHARLVSLNGNATLVTTDLDTTKRHEGKPLDGPYPDCDKVIPDGEPSFTVRFDANKLALLAKTLAFGDRVQPILRLEFYGKPGDLKAAKITRTLDDGSEVLALIMPCRS